MQSCLRSVSRTLLRCLVCGSSEVRSDEVIDRGVVLLAECPRCEYRWTRRPVRAPLHSVDARADGGAVGEVATAA